ncbi:aldose epimerase family protein [Flagellimonas crocea]|uniref:aldose epimerase family protein n=1 Tax=Flagellimonas crocea TaxID=3067311 RepID=UPI00296E51B4|nr:aldose epimerase family protein [Muricauda sp. DH64]
MTNTNGIEITFIPYGQRLVSLKLPDKDNGMVDIVLGYSTIGEYMDHPSSYYGAFIGRYANRIAKGQFRLDGVRCQLSINGANHHLHGGDLGFHNKTWEVKAASGNTLIFRGISPDGEQGYPGTVEVEIRYELNDLNELHINYWARPDKATHINFTHHSFFNLKGHGNGNIEDHILQINADAYTPIDRNLIPTGSIQAVRDTPMDFTRPKPIGDDIDAMDDQLLFGKGYDHNFVLQKSTMTKGILPMAASVLEPRSGRKLELYTDEPGLQFYSGNFLDGSRGKSGKTYSFRGAFCLEPQHFPDSPNQPSFPSTLFKAGEVYTSSTMFKFIY